MATELAKNDATLSFCQVCRSSLMMIAILFSYVIRTSPIHGILRHAASLPPQRGAPHCQWTKTPGRQQQDNGTRGELKLIGDETGQPERNGYSQCKDRKIKGKHTSEQMIWYGHLQEHIAIRPVDGATNAAQNTSQ